MIKKIELVEKTVLETTVKLIAECNGYDVSGKLIQQFSRSPFVFSNELTDEEIIQSLSENEYNQYL